MPAAFHGHDVLELVAETARPLSRDQLLDEIARRFGADATFFTCKAEGLTARELLLFFLTRGKLAEVDGVVVGRGLPCSHDSEPSEERRRIL
jgi:probable metal-binding protein